MDAFRTVRDQGAGHNGGCFPRPRDGVTADVSAESPRRPTRSTAIDMSADAAPFPWWWRARSASGVKICGRLPALVPSPTSTREPQPVSRPAGALGVSSLLGCLGDQRLVHVQRHPPRSIGPENYRQAIPTHWAGLPLAWRRSRHLLTAPEGCRAGQAPGLMPSGLWLLDGDRDDHSPAATTAGQGTRRGF